MNTPVVELENVSFAYNGEPTLEEVNLAVRPGDFMAMIGPNGGGKTTLLRLMLGLLKPKAGNIRVFGRTARRASSSVGYVPQNVNINSSFPITALDVVLMGKLDPGKRWTRRPASDRKEAIGCSGGPRDGGACAEEDRRALRWTATAGFHRPGSGEPAQAAYCSMSPRPASTPRARPISTDCSRSSTTR